MAATSRNVAGCGRGASVAGRKPALSSSCVSLAASLVMAAATGSVIAAGWNGGGYGNYVLIDHGNGYQTLYAHLLNKSITVSTGQKVNQGQQIGTMGSTGRSTGTHLHFEIRSTSGNVDPLKMLK